MEKSKVQILVRGRAMLRNLLSKMDAGVPPFEILGEIGAVCDYLDKNECPIKPTPEQTARLEQLSREVEEAQRLMVERFRTMVGIFDEVTADALSGQDA